MRALLRSALPVIACAVLVCGGTVAAAPVAGAAPCDTPTAAADRRASRILAEERPFAPTNQDRFFSFENPAWAGAAPVVSRQGPDPTEDETRLALQAFLERRFPCAPERVRAGMDVYGNPIAREKVPDPTLRAALAALTGTVGEPAIDFLLYVTPVARVEFGIYVETATGLPGRVGGTYGSPDGTQIVVIDRAARHAPFGVFSPLLVHEALHSGADGDEAGLPEETVASAVETLVYMEMLLADPSLALLPDAFTRGNNNYQALVRLNSGPPGSDRLTLFVPGGEVSIDPVGLEPVTEFAQLYPAYSAPADPAWPDRETTGNRLLWEILARLAEPGSNPPGEGAGFDAVTLAFVDANQGVLSPAELIAVACILELDAPCAG